MTALGWECPSCHRCHSPDVATCPTCPVMPLTTNVAGLIYGTCAHSWRLNGVCCFCGHCAHTSMMNGVCLACKGSPFVASQAGCV